MFLTQADDILTTGNQTWQWNISIHIPLFVDSPPARWGLLDFKSNAPLLRLVVLHPSSFLPRRTSLASSRSQWASPDLIWQLLIAVGLAGPLLPALDRCGPRRTQPARAWALWASPDLNRWDSESRGPRRTSTGEIRSAVGLAAP